ncbi:hypothetical protein ACFSNO_33725 [Streptomyces cirratus]
MLLDTDGSEDFGSVLVEGEPELAVRAGRTSVPRLVRSAHTAVAHSANAVADVWDGTAPC